MADRIEISVLQTSEACEFMSNHAGIRAARRLNPHPDVQANTSDCNCGLHSINWISVHWSISAAQRSESTVYPPYRFLRVLTPFDLGSLHK